MGRDRYRILDRSAPYFLTCTVLQWLPLFAQPANARILLDSLEYLQREGGLTLYGYVILENHCHLVGRSPDIGKTMASFKSYTAGAIIKRLTELRSPVLELLAFHKARHKTDREHQVWQEGSHPEQIEGEAMMLDALVTEAEQAISLLQERRTAIISAAVTGKIDVRGLVQQAAA